MDALPVIEGEVTCMECGYNLHTLRVDQRCPECGMAIVDTLRRILAISKPGTLPEIFDAVEAVERTRYDPIMKSAECSIDAAMFIWDAIQFGRTEGLAPKTAADVCEVVRDFSLKYFNDVAEAQELLIEWGIHRSEDVGRIVFGFVEAGWLKAEPEESAHDFERLFTLDTLFSRKGGKLI